jgi:ATP-dependent helicase/nuclease subunit A
VKLRERNKEDHLSGIDLHRAINSAEAEAERLRLLYVATTRAADYLVLSGGVFNWENPSGPWTKLLADHFDLQTGKCLATLPKGSEAPELKVTTEPPPTEFSTVSVSRCDLEQETERALQLAKEPAIGDDSTSLAQPLAVDAAARRRFSVSQLCGELQPADDVAPFVMLDENDQAPPLVAPAELGTLVHRALARVDFAAGADVAALIRRITESSATNVEDHAEVAEETISQFLKSARARELAQARAVHRELEFLLAWPPRDTIGSPSPTLDGANTKRYLQGFIDCLYQDAQGKWHLLDYKTNRISAENVTAAADQYEMQLGVYALAVEQILGQPPVELIVHFLRPAAEHRFAWDAAMRRRTIEQVNQGMAAMVNETAKDRALPVEPRHQVSLFDS